MVGRLSTKNVTSRWGVRKLSNQKGWISHERNPLWFIYSTSSSCSSSLSNLLWIFSEAKEAAYPGWTNQERLGTLACCAPVLSITNTGSGFHRHCSRKPRANLLTALCVHYYAVAIIYGNVCTLSTQGFPDFVFLRGPQVFLDKNGTTPWNVRFWLRRDYASAKQGRKRFLI